MNFADAKWLMAGWALIPVVALVWFAGRLLAKRYRAVISDPQRRRKMIGDVSKGRVLAKMIFSGLAVLLVVVALARPRWGFEWSEVTREGADIIVAIDLSKSMLAADVAPNRLERAKRELFDLLNMLKGDRIGIVAFAGSAFVQCPLTLDYDAVRMFLGLLNTDLIPVPGTAIKEAMVLAQRSFKEASPEDSRGRALILMTDGEDEAENMEAVVKLANEAEIQVYAMGFGTTGGAPIPDKGGGFKKDANGSVVLSKLNPQALEDLASRSGGAYVMATAGDGDLEAIYQTGIRGNVEQKEFAAGRVKVWFERFQWPLALAFLFWFGDFFLRYAHRGNTTIIVLLLAFAALGRSEMAEAQWGVWQGQKSFEEGDFEAAGKRFGEAAAKNEDSFQHRFNEGVAQYRQGKYEEAEKAFEEAADKGSAAEKARALFNAGNAAAGKGKLEDAAKAYERALEQVPNDDRAQENLAFVKKLLEEQKKQNQDNKDNKDNKDEKNKQDQQQQDQQDKQKGDQEKQDQQDQNDQQQKDDDEEKENKPEENEEKKQTEAEKQAEKDKQQQAQPDEGEAAEKTGQAQEQPADGKQMSKSEAQRLLESIDDKMEKYQYIPRKQDQQQRPRGQDW